ncbi:MAG: 3-dehydroquinate synthase [Oligosphaeraceae bacterium]
MASLSQIPVRCSGGTYQVSIGPGALSLLPQVVSGLGARRVAVITDSNVAPLHADRVRQFLPPDSPLYVFPAGEASKTLGTIAGMLDFLAEAQLTRGDLVVALGGGVAGDMAGFTAAIYLRGIPVVQLPTTLLAAIDSSVGGKTGVDLPQGKNLAGAFWQPSAVLCDTTLMETLPRRILFDGAAEAVKYGMIRDAALFRTLASPRGLQTHLQEVVARCVEIKAEIVAGDEFDRGERALLNFGHTLGHAVERESQFAISHGQAVAIGMVAVTRWAERRGWCPENLHLPLVEALKEYELPTELPYPWERLTAAMLHDKKRRGDRIQLVVPDSLGRCVLKTISVEELRTGEETP